MMRRMPDASSADLGDLRRRMRAALESMHLDSNDWLSRAQSMGLSMEEALLAVPVDAAKGDVKDSMPRERLRQLMLDAAYQVR
jgi:hypothetical protein